MNKRLSFVGSRSVAGLLAMAVLVVLVVLVVLTAALVLADAPVRAQQQSSRGEIAFLRGQGYASAHLFFVGADGTGLRSSGTRADDFPVWSPDGTRLAFPVEGARARLYVTDADGTHRRPLTRKDPYSCYWLSWSPNSRRVAYTLNGGCGSALGPRVRVVGASGAGDKVLVRTYSLDPVWSPDGKDILYTDGGYKEKLFVVSAAGGHGKSVRGATVRSPNGYPMRPAAAWSRDGKRIFFIGEDNALWRVNRSGGGRRDLTPKLYVWSFEVSPDGRSIVLGGTPSKGPRGIYRLSTAGGLLRRLSPATGVVDSDPRWSPDGRLIAFTRNAPGGQRDIYVMDAQGHRVKRVTSSPLDDVAPAWRPARF